VLAYSHTIRLLGSEELETSAGEMWDKFYAKHQNRFFQSRNYLQREHPELSIPEVITTTFNTHSLAAVSNRIESMIVMINRFSQERRLIMEVGCGTGSTLFPLMQLNPLASFYALDFSPTAIECVRVRERERERHERHHKLQAHTKRDATTR